MKIVFEKIFKDLNNTFESGNLTNESIVAMSSNGRDNKNSFVFDFIFDNNGDYSFTGSKHGFGKIVNLFGRITTPEDGNFCVKIVSSDGGGGQWENVKTNQEVSCTINTSFWHETTITVSIHSNKPNSSGHAVIEYFI
ncbi:hypothetical protein [Clostridium sp. C2-6-12]|uniref:hypothetical protein n=1 Tax=Clostridium sp. C2-6-12 TaxID=2698832 RepID=UPI00136C3F7D|nr:hypothetical protein [Clostridium sp. C2-6-12]